MVEIKEEVIVNVNEGRNAFVNDVDFHLSTAESNESNYETQVINGILDSLIISTNKQCEILISFSELDVTVYHNLQYDGIKYIPLRLQGITPDNQLLLSASAKLLLNNKLRITIRGQSQTEVSLTLRIINA